jgi:hypothetical protein
MRRTEQATRSRPPRSSSESAGTDSGDERRKSSIEERLGRRPRGQSGDRRQTGDGRLSLGVATYSSAELRPRRAPGPLEPSPSRHVEPRLDPRRQVPGASTLAGTARSTIAAPATSVVHWPGVTRRRWALRAREDPATPLGSAELLAAARPRDLLRSDSSHSATGHPRRSTSPRSRPLKRARRRGLLRRRRRCRRGAWAMGAANRTPVDGPETPMFSCWCMCQPGPREAPSPRAMR